MGYKEGSVWRLSNLPSPFFFTALASSSLICFPSAAIFTSRGGWQSSWVAPAHFGTHTQVYSRASRRAGGKKNTYIKQKLWWTNTRSQVHTETCARFQLQEHHTVHLRGQPLPKTYLCLFSPHPPPPPHRNTSNLPVCQPLKSLWKQRGASLSSISKQFQDIFMQINVLFCSKAVPIPESFYPCFAKDTVGPFLRNILLSKGIVISMSHHTSAQETRARLTASQRKKNSNNTHCMAVWSFLAVTS